MGSLGIAVRTLTADDWAALADVRLRALAADPQAFGSSLAAERDRDEATWRSRAERRAIAFRGAVGLGLVGWTDIDASGEVEIIAMWVDPGSRRAGVGAVLVAHAVAVITQARPTAQIALGHVEGNAAARDLYLRCGFVHTGAATPLHSDPTKRILAMRLADPVVDPGQVASPRCAGNEASRSCGATATRPGPSR